MKTQPRRTAAVSSCWRRAVRRTEWRWRTGASFRSCHLHVCGTGWRRGLAAAAGATSLFGRSSASSPSSERHRRAPLRPPCAARVLEGRGSGGGGGRGLRVDARSEAPPAGSVRPCAQEACQPGLGGSGGDSRKGLTRGRQGLPHGGGNSRPGATLWGRALPDLILSPSVSGTQLRAASC